MQRDSWQLEQTRDLRQAMGSEEAAGVEESMMRTPWTGCGTALVTPFTREGAVDEAGVRRLARRQIDAGIHFLVPCGTTGESPTLTEDERVRVVRARRRGSRRAGPGAGGRGRIRHERGHPLGPPDEAGGRRRVSSRSRPTTTSRRPKASSSTTARLPATLACRSSSTTCPAERAATSTWPRSSA